TIISFCLARLGMVALHQGDLQQTTMCLLEGLARTQHSGIRRWSRWYLVGLAEVARLGGMSERAAQLIGASEGVLSAPGANYEPATHDEIERIIAGVRADLDEETFDRFRSQGREMPLEEVMAYASESLPSDDDPKTKDESGNRAFLE